jgi:hypothetical protein
VQKIIVVESKFIAAPTEVVAKVVGQHAFGGNVGRHGSYCDVVCAHRSERAVIGGGGGIKESIVVQIIAAWRFARPRIASKLNARGTASTLLRE